MAVLNQWFTKFLKFNKQHSRASSSTPPVTAAIPVLSEGVKPGFKPRAT